MPRPSRVAAQDVLDCIAEVFRERGYEGATLAELSRATGLGRASLYHHFPGGKQQMAERALHHVAEQAQSKVLSCLTESGEPRARLGKFAKAVASFYQRGQVNCILGSLLLSGGSQQVGETLHDGMKQWVDAVRRVLLDAGLPRPEATRRAEDAVARIQGSLVISRGLGTEAPFVRTMKELPDDLLAH